MIYLRNLARFFAGFVWIFTRAVPPEKYDQPNVQIMYREGWGPWRFLPLYLIDYGTKVLLGGACVSWSRWFFDNQYKWKIAGWINKALDRVDRGHGMRAGPTLWGTQSVRGPLRVVIVVGWLALIFWLVWVR
jgi:hypothetical protein